MTQLIFILNFINGFNFYSKRKHVVRKLKISSHDMEEEKEVEDASEFVSRELKKKKTADAAALKKALEIVKEIEVPA